jgi:hypothetical protein
MTNTKSAANYLASKGRYGDSTLVHMSPIEVWALERMSPDGKLPRNPDTGMPEAFSLTSLLPAAVGIGASILSGGALTPLMAGALSGLTSYATTGDLGKGLMSGLMSFGVGSALGDLASPAAEAGANTLYGAAPVATSAIGAAAPAATETAKLGGIEGLTSAFNNVTGPGGGDLLKNVFVDNFKETTLPIAGSILGSSALEPPEPLKMKKEPTSAELQAQYPEQFPDPVEVRFPGSDYLPGTSGEFDYFRPLNGMAEGGIASLMANPDLVYAKGGVADPDGSKASKANIAAEAKMALLDHHPKAKEALARYESAFGAEALDDLRSRVRQPGGRIRGAGGGLDDLIPGTIEGRRDVRLADGEFVVPADVVSMLGDGSSDHGVRKLHEMMDRVRLNKTGSKKQAKSIKDGAVMPA